MEYSKWPSAEVTEWTTRIVTGKLVEYRHKSQGRTRFQDWAWSSVKNSREAKKDEDEIETLRLGQEKVIRDLRRHFKGVRIPILKSTLKTDLGYIEDLPPFSFGILGPSMKQKWVEASCFHCLIPREAAYRVFEFDFTL